MGTTEKVVCLSLLLLQLLVAVDGQPPGEIDQTVYILNKTESVELSCGAVPDDANGIEWNIYDTNAKEFKRIFKFYHTISGRTTKYANGYTEKKYLIDESVNTSLLVKDITLSDTGRLSCVPLGVGSDYQYIVMLQVVVPPTDDSDVTLGRGNIRAAHQADIRGPYLENKSEEFTCYIRDVLPGKESTAFRYYYSGNPRLKSRDDVGKVLESKDTGRTKFVEWKFSTSFNREDNGKAIRCLVDWKAGQYEKKNLGSQITTVVQVYFATTKLEMIAFPPGQVREQTDAVFKCLSGEGNPQPEIKWSHGTGTNRGIKGRYEAFKTESTLELRVDKTMNKEEVRCFIEADEARAQTRKEQKVTLRVEFVATKIEMETVPQGDVKEGVTVQYMCATDSAYPNPPDVLWSVGGLPVTTGDGHTITSVQSDGDYSGQKTRSTLRLTVDRSMNQKQVKCVLKNKDEEKAEHRLTVTFQPDGLHIDIGGAVKENTEKTVTCTANSSNPASLVSMEFFIDEANQSDITPEVTLTDGTNGGQLSMSEFVFTSTRQQNRKVIKCRMFWDGIYTDKEKEYSHLNITYPPEVRVDGATFPVVEYATRKLDCITTGGNPSSPGEYNYTWVYSCTYTESNIDLPIPHGSVILNGGRTLQLKDIGYEEMAGTYSCIVTSIGGQNSGTSTLVVYYPAKSENRPEDMTVFAALHTAVSLSIKFRMNPVTDYRIEWSIGDITVPEAKLTKTVNGESVVVVYVIPDVNEKSLGNHTVRVINNAIEGGLNDATFIVTLMLPGPPEKPMSVSWTVFLNSIAVTWKVGLNGGFEQFFIVRYREKGRQTYETSSEIRGLKTGEQGYYTINGLYPKKEYDVLVVSVNGFGGKSETLSDVLAVTTQDLPGIDRTGLIVGLSMAVLVAIILGSVILGFLLLRRFRRSSGLSTESSPTNERTEPQYLNMIAVEGIKDYEVPTVETSAPPSIYSQLKTTDYEEVQIPNDS